MPFSKRVEHAHAHAHLQEQPATGKASSSSLTTDDLITGVEDTECAAPHAYAPSPSRGLHDASRGPSRLVAILSGSDDAAAGLSATVAVLANPAPNVSSSASASGGDVLRDAEAYLWGEALAKEDCAAPEIADTTAGSSICTSGPLRSPGPSSLERQVHVATLHSVSLAGLAGGEDAAEPYEVFSDAWTELAANIPAQTQIQRPGSTRLSRRVEDALVQGGGGADAFEGVLTSSIGPVAPYTIAKEVLDSSAGSTLLLSRVWPLGAVGADVPSIFASAEEESPDCEPIGWLAYSTAAARAAASRAAAGATEMAAAQVPGGALAVAAVNSGAKAVAASRATETAVGVAQHSLRAADAPAELPLSSSPAQLNGGVPLRSTTAQVSATVTESTTRRHQQLKLYVTQNFVPTFSDFVPGTNQLVGQAVVKTRAWATARVKVANQRDGEGSGPVAQTQEACVADLCVEEEGRRLGSSLPTTESLRVEAHARELTCEVGSRPLNEDDTEGAAEKDNASVFRKGQPSDSPHVVEHAGSTRRGPPQQTEVTATVNVTEAVAVDVTTRSTSDTIVPYATLRVLLCRCDGGARSGNDPVEAFAKFRRMPCKRKLQEVFGNLAYNLLPPAPNTGKQRSPFREVDVLHAQQMWSGALSDARVDMEAASPAVSAVEEVDGITGARRTETFTQEVVPASADPGRTVCLLGPDEASPSRRSKHEGEEKARDRAATSKERTSLVFLNPLSPPTVEDPLGVPHTARTAEAMEASLSCPATASEDAASPPHSATATYQAYMSYGQQRVLYNAQYGVPKLHSWSREFPCCCTASTCRESCCCLHCQLARQCNMLNYRRPTVLWPLCCLACVLDPCTCFTCSSMLACFNRAAVRSRYGIGGSFLGDCLFALLCTRCATAQVMDEMMEHDDYPGGLCLLPPLASPAPSPMR